MSKLSPKTIELIEDAPLNKTDRFYLLLTALGEKAGSWIIMSSQIWRQGDEPYHLDEAAVAAVIRAIESAGLGYKLVRRPSDRGLVQNDEKRRRWRESLDVFVAADQDKAESLATAAERGDNEALGLGLGYPATAVEAFKTRHRKDYDNMSLSLQLSEEVLALQWVLSADHWGSELEVIGRWLTAGRKVDEMIVAEFEADELFSFDLREKLRKLAKQVEADH